MRSVASNYPLLKKDRPSNTSIISIVRDAVCRMPSGVGTRSDVVELCKDSQYLNEITEADESHFSTTIGGGLDRLQAEEDPICCYEPHNRIWVNLHINRKVTDQRF